MRLQEHFGDACRVGEIAVHLEGRVRGEHVREQVVLEQTFDHFVSLVAFFKARPKCGAPRPGPRAAGVAGRAAQFERFFCGFREFRCLGERDFASRINGEKVRRVAVSADHVRAVNHPFLQVAVFGNFIRSDAGEFFSELFCPGGIYAENVCSGDGVSEKVANELLVVGDPVFRGTPFVRPAVRRDERSRGHAFELVEVDAGFSGVEAFSVFAEFFEMVFPKVAGFLHHRIGLFFQKFLIVGKLIVLPHVEGIPRVNRNIPHGPSAPAPGILRNAGGPAAMIFAELFFRHCARCGSGLGDVVQKRHVAFRKIGNFGGPVGFLNIDIVVVVACPGRVDFVVPKPLKIGGKRIF